MGLINTRDPAAAAHAYTGILGWSLAVGHCHRPRAGCTCADRFCRTPGAHPRHSGSFSLAGVEEQLLMEPGAALIAATEAFDALMMPVSMAMATMVRLDAEAPVPVPCLRAGDHGALLVQAGSGTLALTPRSRPLVTVRSGPGGWLALPPSAGTSWDTPPWAEPQGDPVRLLHGSDVRPYLHGSCSRSGT